MIKAVMVMNTQGKPRLAKFYDYQTVEKQQELIRSVFAVELRISENELAMLDLIQVFVETLDKCFSNVCELDIVFGYGKMHTILDEIILGGQVLETSSTEIMKAVDEISKLEASSSAMSIVTKSVSGWRR